MTVIEKKEEIAANYHCNDIHAETCVDTCTTCERYLRDDLDELEKEIRADERAKVIEEILSLSKCTSNIHCMMPKNWCISCWNHIIYYDDVYKLKEQNDETLTDDFDKYVDSQLV